jgi:hypothetical protein
MMTTAISRGHTVQGSQDNCSDELDIVLTKDTSGLSREVRATQDMRMKVSSMPQFFMMAARE